MATNFSRYSFPFLNCPKDSENELGNRILAFYLIGVTLLGAVLFKSFVGSNCKPLGAKTRKVLSVVECDSCNFRPFDRGSETNMVAAA